MKCNSDKCHCPCCKDGDEVKLFYTVKPFNWAHGGRDGVTYQVMEMRAIATAKCKDDADMIVEALNGHRKLQRENTSLRARAGMEVREAMIQEVANLPYCRWSSHRKQIVDFGQAVLRRLGTRSHTLD